ncbi:adenylate cyclase [Rhodopirellula sp. JC740]|uniref:Adenylate cyclase n=1 Tax=Rhodopirellula halodulae TaxID=2894198 RepID=A0ABS8NF44_9BACT|nr:adenylate cyclase [Rhodopirellula sp. JC740]MCC9642153.1 adenylate cyclase [Rhodopirellula sp. JC740]
MNKLNPQQLSLNSPRRRWIRTSATVLILGMLMGLAWKPRLLSETYLRDASHVLINDENLLPIGEPASQEVLDQSQSQKAASPRHLWYVGGFPLDAYQTKFSLNEGRDGLETWGVFGTAMWIDAWFCCGILALAGIAAFFYEPGCKPWRLLWTPTGSTSRRYQVSLVGLTIVGLLATVWHFHSTQSRLRFLRQQGLTTLTCSTKHPMIARLPLKYRGPWTHASRVQCTPRTNFNELNWNHYPSLEFVSLYGNLSANQLTAMEDLSWITTLRWYGIPRIESSNQLLQELPDLRCVSLSFHLPEERLQSDQPTQLRVDSQRLLSSLAVRKIPRAAINTEELLSPSLLTLDIQTTGPSPKQWVFEEAPSLQSLTLRHERERRSLTPEIIDLTVRVMPSLTTLSLDAGIPMKLSLMELPRLVHLQGIDSHSMRFTRGDSDNSYTLWASELHLSNLSSMSHLEVSGENFENWTVKDCPRLYEVVVRRPRTGMMMFRRQASRFGEPREVFGSEMWASIMGPRHSQIPSVPKNLIAWASSFPYLQSLNLSGLNLRQCDLDHLHKNAFLKSLTLDYCQFDSSQLRSLRGVKSIRELSVSGSEVDQSIVPELLSMHNEWEALELPWETFDDIRIADQPKLKRAFLTRTLRAKTVELENLDSFVSRIRIAAGAERIRLVNLPCLTEVSIRRPRTSDLVVQNVPNLLSFTLERGVLSAETLKSLTQSRQLHSLILPGTQIPEDLASNFPNWPGLQEINAIATPIRDQDLAHLPSLKSLRRVRLDNTQLTAKGLTHLGRCDRLQSLSLVGLDLSSSAFEPLLGLSWLMELSVNDSIVLPQELDSVRMAPEDWATGERNPQLANSWPPGFTRSLDAAREFFRRGPARGARRNWVANEETDSNERGPSRPKRPTIDAT